MEEKELISSTDNLLISQVCEILKENNINYIRRDSGAGGYLNIAMGGSTEEKKIFVNDTDYEKAKDLIEIFMQPIDLDTDDDEIPEELKEYEEPEEEKEDIQKYEKVRHYLILFVVGLVLVMLISCTIAVII